MPIYLVIIRYGYGEDVGHVFLQKSEAVKKVDQINADHKKPKAYIIEKIAR